MLPAKPHLQKNPGSCGILWLLWFHQSIFVQDKPNNGPKYVNTYLSVEHLHTIAGSHDIAVAIMIENVRDNK